MQILTFLLLTWKVLIVLNMVPQIPILGVLCKHKGLCVYSTMPKYETFTTRCTLVFESAGHMFLVKYNYNWSQELVMFYVLTVICCKIMKFVLSSSCDAAHNRRPISGISGILFLVLLQQIGTTTHKSMFMTRHSLDICLELVLVAISIW